MILFLDAILVFFVSILIDRYIGEVPNRFHPLRWMGNILTAIDKKIHKRLSESLMFVGFISYMFLFLLSVCVGVGIISFCSFFVSEHISQLVGEIVWIILTSLVFKISFAIYSFRRHCIPICHDIKTGNVNKAASEVQMIVSRDTKYLDADHINSQCCETVSENLVDSVYSPVFYFGLFGIIGSMMFRCANLMDAMWGYINNKYCYLGFFPAKFDDVLGFITSRMSPYFVTVSGFILGMNWRNTVCTAKAEHNKTPSPNSGWSMAAISAALGVRMEKIGVYIIGMGDMPTVHDVYRCCTLIELSSMLFMLVIGVSLYGFIGVRIQLCIEAIFIHFWSVLI